MNVETDKGSDDNKGIDKETRDNTILWSDTLASVCSTVNPYNLQTIVERDQAYDSAGD